MINENTEQETQGVETKDTINQDKKQTQSIELVSPKAGTATSSPHIVAASQTDKVFATAWFTKKEAYAESTKRKAGQPSYARAKGFQCEKSQDLKE